MEKSPSAQPVRSTADLAARLGLSRWTVSRALNGHAGIRPETAERVREAARASGFAPDAFGRALRGGRTHWIGIGLPDLVDYFLTDKLRRLQEAIHAAGRQTLFQILEPGVEGEREMLERFAAMRCAGVVSIASRLHADDAAIAKLEETGVPIVRVDPARPGGRLEVSTDRAHAMRAAVRRLHDLGHRRLVVAGVSDAGLYGRQRLRGLRQGCADCGWDFTRDVRRLEGPESADDFRRGGALAEEFLRGRPRGFHAILAVNDRVALGLMQEFSRRGVAVPAEVSVLGYDNADFSNYVSPAITTIDPGVEELIERAVALLLDPPAGGGRLAVKPRLVERGTLAAPPGRR